MFTLTIESVISNTISRSIVERYLWLRDLCPFLLRVVGFIDNYLQHIQDIGIPAAMVATGELLWLLHLSLRTPLLIF